MPVAEGTAEEPPRAPRVTQLKQLPDAIEESIFVDECFPVIIDPTEQAGRFLKYQVGTFILADIDHAAMQRENLNKSLVGALQFGRTLTLKFASLESITESIFDPEYFPMEILDRSKFYQPEVWKSILRPESLGDMDPEDFIPSQEFAFIIVTTDEFVPPALSKTMSVVKCEDGKASSSGGGYGNGGDGKDNVMDAVATLYGAAEVVRNSKQLVEAAFDGDMEEIQSWIDKGFHLESTDGRKHSGLSEAASQGHKDIVNWFLEQGANPNAVSDTGRSPLWRAAFNGHTEVVQILLEAGGDPDALDKTSHETAYDVSENAETRQALQDWDRGQTEKLIETRRREMLAKMEERIKTSAEREAYAKMQLRQELITKADAGDVDGIKMLLEITAEEAENTGQRPRATAEVRNVGGQSMLSIAAQRDDEELTKFLLTHWKNVDKDRWDLVEGEISVEGKTFKVNVNSRDLKGWTCVCIAVFHDSFKVLQLLLEAGGDPNIRSSYNKNAWDLAKDELDAAENIVRSRAEIRQVLIDNDTSSKTSVLFGTSTKVEEGDNPNRKETNKYKEVGPDGSPVMLQEEMAKDVGKVGPKKKAAAGGAAKGAGAAKKSTKGAGGGKGKAKK